MERFIPDASSAWIFFFLLLTETIMLKLIVEYFKSVELVVVKT